MSVESRGFGPAMTQGRKAISFDYWSFNAVGVGFEPTEDLHPRLLSRRSLEMKKVSKNRAFIKKNGHPFLLIVVSIRSQYPLFRAKFERKFE